MKDKIYWRERRLLQISVLIAACVPVIAGGAGMIFGASMLSGTADISLDSHIRYLSGLLLAIGISFWAAVPAIERKTAHVDTQHILNTFCSICLSIPVRTSIVNYWRLPMAVKATYETFAHAADAKALKLIITA